MTASSPAKTTSRPRSFTARYALGIPLAIAVGVALYYNLLPISKALTYRLLRLEEGSHLGSSIEFLVFEIPKVLLLLTGVVFAVGIIRSFFTPQKTRALLAGRREFVGNLMAGGLGVVTPFCTCSAIPMFIGFVSAGIPLGVTFSFLIAAPLVNEVALGLLLSLFGWKVALLYLSTGLSIAIFAGWILGKLKLEKWVEPWVFKAAQQSQSEEAEKLSWPDRIDQGLQATREIVLKVTPYLILGIAVGGRDSWVCSPGLSGRDFGQKGLVVDPHRRDAGGSDVLQRRRDHPHHPGAPGQRGVAGRGVGVHDVGYRTFAARGCYSEESAPVETDPGLLRHRRGRDPADGVPF